MKCPTCKSEDHFVLETRVVSDTVTRRRNQCAAAHRWSTYERVDLSTLDATRSGKQPLPVASSDTTCSARPKEVITATCSVQTLPVALAPRSTGGKGGSALGQISGQNLAPSEPPVQTRPRVKLKPKDIDYPAEFEAQWLLTHKTGSKANALAEWESFGRPAYGASWVQWARLDGWRRGFVPHVATWLHDRRFQQEPVEVKKTPSNMRPASDPTPVADIAAATERKLAAARAVVPATREELEQLRQRS